MNQEVKAYAKQLAQTAPCACAFKLGDRVSFTNDQGVTFEGLHVIGFEAVCPGEEVRERFIHLDTCCYWFPKRPDQLTMEQEAVA